MAGIAGSHYWSEYRRNYEQAKAASEMRQKMEDAGASA